jgi:hypothetical protein
MNGDWPEMQKLVISKMTEHSKKLDRLHDDLSTLKTHVATLQLITATNYDIALDGEAGTLGGVALTATLLEWLRKK